MRITETKSGWTNEGGKATAPKGSKLTQLEPIGLGSDKLKFEIIFIWEWLLTEDEQGGGVEQLRAGEWVTRQFPAYSLSSPPLLLSPFTPSSLVQLSAPLPLFLSIYSFGQFTLTHSILAAHLLSLLTPICTHPSTNQCSNPINSLVHRQQPPCFRSPLHFKTVMQCMHVKCTI